MGKLIVMPQAPTTSGRGFEAGHTAEILFFTGVRYYRMTDDAGARKEARRAYRRSAKRRREIEARVERIG